MSTHRRERPRARTTKSLRRVGTVLTAVLLLTALLASPMLSAPAGAQERLDGFATGGGNVHEFGSAVFHGSLNDVDLPTPVVAMDARPSGSGYWLVTEDGAVHAFGSAAHHGDPSSLDLAAPIVDITSTPSGNGYWLAASDGGVFGYGDAAFHGSAGAIDLVAPVVSMEATATGNGYWLAATDGGVFSYGDAPFLGSGAQHMSAGQSVVGAAIAPGGSGYWLATSGGAVFSFGDAVYHGGVAASQGEPVATITSTGDGYWLSTTLGQDEFDTPIPANSGHGERIVYSNSGQRVWLIDSHERIVATYLVSGRHQTPSPGNYRVFSKSRYASAGHDGITMEYMVRFAHGRRLAIGFHSIPTYGNGQPMQSESQLGTYRSSGCVRQRLDQAKFLFEWADVGLDVVVLP